MKRRFLAGSSLIAAAALGFAGAASAETFEANNISFRDFTGAVEITTSATNKIDVEIRQGKTQRPVTLVEENGAVIITGEKWRDEEDRNCCDKRISRDFEPRKGRELTTGDPLNEALFEHYPTIVVAMPFEGDVEFLDARIKLAMERLDGALKLEGCYVYGEASDVDEAVIGLVHGSRLVVGNVDAGLEVDVSGDADLLVGDAAIVDIDMAGPGDVILGEVDGILDVSIAGSGLVRVNRADGPVTARIAGSGGLAVKDGRADRLRATIDGSGGVFFGGNVHQPVLRLYGSSEVRLGSVTGGMTRHGGGDVYVNERLVAKQ